MEFRNLVVVAILYFTSINYIHADEKVQIKIFYQSRDEHAKKFFNEQLAPNWDLFKDYVEVIFVPFGNSWKRQDEIGDWHFICENGPLECNYNKYHACIVNKIKDNNKQVKYITCLMDKMYQAKYYDKCARESKVSRLDMESIELCTQTEEEDFLLSEFGKETIKQDIMLAPTLFIDGVHNKKLEKAMLRDFPHTICEYINNKKTAYKDICNKLM